MRILYLTQWFEPEPNIVKGVAFVRALEAAGHDVTVVTGIPNYPTGKLYPGYRLRPIQRETIKGVRVVRLPLYPSHDTSSLRRSLNFLSFFVSVLAYCLFRRKHFDIAYIYHPPITVGLAAALAAILRPLPFILDVQDLWPDTIAATGMTGARRLVGPLGALCRLVYRQAEAIVVQSEGMRRALIERGVPKAKVTTIRNWADVQAPPAHAASTNRRFTMVYGGNLGRAQALEAVVDAAAIVERSRQDIDIILYGDGIDAAMLRDRAKQLEVVNLRFEGRLPQKQIIDVFARADALLLHLSDDPLFAITIPSKTQFYFAMGRPIVAGVGGEAAELLRDSGGALVVPPSDAPALARAICTLADLPAERRAEMGRSASTYYRAKLSFEEAMDRTLRVLEGTHQRLAPTDQAATT